MHKSIPFFDQNAVRKVLQMPSLIVAMEKAVCDFSSGKVLQPVRSVVPITKHNGFLGLMPAYVTTSKLTDNVDNNASSSSSSSNNNNNNNNSDTNSTQMSNKEKKEEEEEEEEEALGVKLVTFYSHNIPDVPTHNAVIALFAPQTGVPLAMMDGSLITELRTAAVSAVAARLLSKPDSSTLCILGSGVQAYSHWDALKLVRNFTTVRLWSRTRENAQKLANYINLPSSVVSVVSTVQEATHNADVIVCATSATEPVLLGKYVSRGSFVAAVGACRPNWREMDDELMQNSTVVVDSKAAAEKESGDVILSKAQVYAELGELVAQRNKTPVNDKSSSSSSSKNNDNTNNTNNNNNNTSLDLMSSLAALKLDHPSHSNSTVVFKSLGMAVEDVVAASLVYKLLR